MPLYKAVTSTDAMSSRTAKISEPVSAFESKNSAKLRDIKIMQWNKWSKRVYIYWYALETYLCPLLRIGCEKQKLGLTLLTRTGCMMPVLFPY